MWRLEILQLTFQGLTKDLGGMWSLSDKWNWTLRVMLWSVSYWARSPSHLAPLYLTSDSETGEDDASSTQVTQRCQLQDETTYSSPTGEQKPGWDEKPQEASFDVPVQLPHYTFTIPAWANLSCSWVPVANVLSCIIQFLCPAYLHGELFSLQSSRNGPFFKSSGVYMHKCLCEKWILFMQCLHHKR